MLGCWVEELLLVYCSMLLGGAVWYGAVLQRNGQSITLHAHALRVPAALHTVPSH